MRLISSLKKSWRKRYSLILILFLSIPIFYIFLLLNNFFLINTFEISGQSKQILRGLNAYFGENLLLLKINDAEKVLLNQNPEIKEIKIDKIYPNRLKISLKKYEPLAFLEVNNGYFLLSEDGQIIAKKKKADLELPTIKYYQKFIYTAFNAGERLTYKDILTSLQILKSLLNLGIRADTIDINGDDMIAFNIENKKILLTTEKDREAQIYELETIIRRFKIEGKSFNILDLRFEKPIVKF